MNNAYIVLQIEVTKCSKSVSVVNVWAGDAGTDAPADKQ